MSLGSGNLSSVYTIDDNPNPSASTNYTNAGYVITEDNNKASQRSSDGLPSYEEAIAGVRIPIVTLRAPRVATAPSATNESNEVVNGSNEASNNDATQASSRRGRRHRHRNSRNHRRHRNTENQQENGIANTHEEHERSRRGHRRGFHLGRRFNKNKSTNN